MKLQKLPRLFPAINSTITISLFRQTTLLVLLLTLNSAKLYSQISAKDARSSIAQQQERLQKEIAFLQLTSSDQIADIGTGAGKRIIPIANSCPSCRFVVEDLDSSLCNQELFLESANLQNNMVDLQQYVFAYGAEKSTGLPSKSYSKVLAFDLIHELTYKKEMLDDIKRIL